jgi:hypothetical protein
MQQNPVEAQIISTEQCKYFFLLTLQPQDSWAAMDSRIVSRIATISPIASCSSFSPYIKQWINDSFMGFFVSSSFLHKFHNSLQK